MKKTGFTFIAFALAIIMAVTILPTGITAGILTLSEELSAALNAEGLNNVFESNGDYPWVVDSTAQVGIAKSGNVGIDDSESTVSTTVTLAEGDIIRFRYLVSSEDSYDKLTFYIDGTEVFTDSGNKDWITYAYPNAIESGEHVLSWTYSKDGSVGESEDAVWLDDVYLGAPISVNEILAPDSLNVAMYSAEVIEYTVLPQGATNKSVTFLSDDPAIATVNDFGRVAGVSEGTTTVTITSVSNPEITAECEVTVEDTGIVPIDFYAYCSTDVSGQNTGNWITFTDRDLSAVESLGAAPSVLCAAECVYETVYGYLDNDGCSFFYASLDSLSEPVITNEGYFGTPYDMAYDYVTKTMFMLGYSSESGDLEICIVDIETGVDESACTLSNNLLRNIVFDENGVCYGLEEGTGVLHTVDTRNGVCTPVGSTGLEVPPFAQGMAYSYETGNIYYAYARNFTDIGFYEINKETASATLMGQIGESGANVTALFTTPSFTQPEEPTDLVQLWDFETPESIEGWTQIDADGDGRSWEVFGGSIYGYNTYDGVRVMGSNSVDDGSGIAAMDNYLLTPEFTVPVMNGRISFWYVGQSSELSYEYFGVYITTDAGETYSEELGYYMSSRAYRRGMIDLSAYAGQSIRVAFRHYNDIARPPMYMLNIDHVELWGGAGILGDINLNGKIETSDAIEILRNALGMVELSELQLALADFDGNDVVNTVDAVLILRHILLTA